MRTWDNLKKWFEIKVEDDGNIENNSLRVRQDDERSPNPKSVQKLKPPESARNSPLRLLGGSVQSVRDGKKWTEPKAASRHLQGDRPLCGVGLCFFVYLVA